MRWSLRCSLSLLRSVSSSKGEGEACTLANMHACVRTEYIYYVRRQGRGGQRRADGFGFRHPDHGPTGLTRAIVGGTGGSWSQRVRPEQARPEHEIASGIVHLGVVACCACAAFLTLTLGAGTAPPRVDRAVMPTTHASRSSLGTNSGIRIALMMSLGRDTNTA